MVINYLNFIWNLEEITRTTKYLKREFELKGLKKTKYFLGLQIEYFPTGILVYQSAYTKKILKRLYIDKAYSISSPMVLQSIDVKNDHFVFTNMMNNYLILKYHILVLFVQLCILLIVLAQILFFLSTY